MSAYLSSLAEVAAAMPGRVRWGVEKFRSSALHQAARAEVRRVRAMATRRTDFKNRLGKPT